MPNAFAGFRIKTPRNPTLFGKPLEQTLGVQGKEPPPYGQPPVEWPGSLAEWAVCWALEIQNIEYVYQANLIGGRTTTGGTVADFYVPGYNLIIRVMGVYWHYEQGPLAINEDQLIKETLRTKGYVVVDIDEDDALAEPLYYVQEALKGIDHSRGETGL